VRDFRWRHWCFTREYILKKTTHPTATGGSPIVTWLPNQLNAVLDAMDEVWEMWEGKGGLKGCGDVMDLLYVQRDTLRKEIRKYCQERGVEA
jgi:indoleamine 2,3-dioxygenase